MFRQNFKRRTFAPARRSGGGGFGGGYKRAGAGGRAIRHINPAIFVKKASEVNDTTVLETITARFSDYQIVDKLKQNIIEHGYTIPTAIQEQALPSILAGRDLIGMANTGTGKTAAFLIGMINKCYLDRAQRVLIVVPTRELAIQVRDEFMIFAKEMNLSAAVVIGGAHIGRQLDKLRNNPNFVIGTPGRLKDLIERRALNLNLFQNVILDEVDRMVDIGFIKDIQYLVSLMPRVRHSLFFSATVDYKTQAILKDFVNDPVTVSVKKQDSLENINQDVVRVPQGREKVDVLHDILNQADVSKVIIFGRTKHGMDKLFRGLVERGFKAATIHGNKSQNQRQKALQLFKQNYVKILIATDVASRGLDIDNVSHVINYDQPETVEDYFHRIGRTGRAGKRGSALTFVD